MNFSNLDLNGIALTGATRVVLITDETSEELATTANELKESDPTLDSQILPFDASESTSYITESEIASYPCLLSVRSDGEVVGINYDSEWIDVNLEFIANNLETA